MKIYCFYIFSHENLSDYYGVLGKEINRNDGIEYSLYAYTDNKEYAKLFEKSRKKELFFKKTFHMSKKEFVCFENNYGEHKLFDYSYRTNFCVDGIYKLNYIRILSTGIEYDTIALGGNQFFDELLGKISESVRILKRGVIKEVYSNAIEEYFDFETYLPFLDGPTEDLPFLPFNLNQLEIYREIFGNTFKESGVYKYALL